MAHPRILAVIRRHHLALAKLNRELAERESDDPETIEPCTLADGDEGPEESEPTDQVLKPWSLLTEGLLTPETMELAILIGRLTYWPVGLDEKGHEV